ncbi:ABC transporter substrate-binding protein [Streptomyces xiamenensis]
MNAMTRKSWRFDRRRFLAAGGAVTLGAGALGALSACTLSPEGGSGDGGGASDAEGEAPELKRLVDEGKLPPLAERIPAEPLVVTPVDEVGRYGGTWRNALIGAGDTFRLQFTLGYENLVRWDLDWNATVPNVAESVTVNEDATRFTFVLREGMKWSDGEPFTVDDVLFAFHDIAMNKAVVPDTPGHLSVDGEPARLERIDDLTVEFTFAAPRALFLEQLASGPSDMLTRLPKHYLSQFHPDYAEDAEQAARDLDYSGAMELLQDAMYAGALWTNPALPRLHAWIPGNAVGDGTKMRFQRNPYYWKVDTAGNQLPYLNGIDFAMVQDSEVLLLNVLQGEIDMLDRHVNTTRNKPVLAAERESGGYRFFDLVPDKLNTLTIMLNLTCQDEARREVFQNRDFRIGLSHAINRQELITTVHARQGEPWQVAPLRESELFDEEMAKQYTEFDLDLAHEYLDRTGWTRRNGEGIRLGPDGKPISFRVLVGTGAGKPELADALELIRPGWRAVGVDMRVQNEDETLRTQLIQANEHQALVWDGDGGLDTVNTPNFFMPEWGDNSAFCPDWFTWLATEGADGQEPPEPAKEQYRIYHEQIAAEPDRERRNALMRQILAIAKEQFWTIGVSTALPGYGIVGEHFRNMVQQTYFAGKFPYPGVTNPEQYYLDSDS